MLLHHLVGVLAVLFESDNCTAKSDLPLQLLQNLGVRDRDPAALLPSVIFISKGNVSLFKCLIADSGTKGAGRRCLGPGFETSVLETPKTS